MGKVTQTQRDFTLGALREGFLEGDDLELRGKSLREALNVRVEATRSLSARPGTRYMRSKAGAYDIIEIRPESGLVFGVMIGASTLEVIDSAARSVASFAAPWADPADVYVEPFGNEAVIGGSWGMRVLRYLAGTWALDAFTFDAASGGDLAQPYWVFNKGVQIKPSATSGSVTVVATAWVFTPQHVGTRIRYGGKEIAVTAYIAPWSVQGTVISTLPPSYAITLASTANIRPGDALVGADSQFQGIVAWISSPVVFVVTTDEFNGPKVGEDISFPAGTTQVSAFTIADPQYSEIWDEQLISPVYGYPRAAASAGGRLTFVDFPAVPDLVCMSSARGIRDFEVGLDDDDAILRQVGENSPRFLHVVNAGDLILFSDAGIYFIDLRSGDPVTPTNFAPVRFDRRSASAVRPVAVDDGVVFVEASGQTIGACQLSGNVNLRWVVRSISIYHSQLIKTPVKLCGPSIFSRSPEKYLFVVNSDGTLAAMSWFEEFSIETIGFVAWDTDGAFRSISPVFGGYWAIIDRFNGATRFLEELAEDVHLDCACAVSVASVLEANGAFLEAEGGVIEAEAPGAWPLAGREVAITGDRWYGGLLTVNGDGSIPNYDDYPAGGYVGLPFTVRAKVWPVERIDTARAGMLRARVIRGAVSVQSTLGVSVRANGQSRSFGGFAFGGDLSRAELMTKVVKFSVTGNRDHPDIEISRSIPGPFRVLAVTQEVQV